MKSQHVSQLCRGLLRLIMLLTAIATTFVVQGYLVAKIVQHNKSLRPVLLKPYNKMIRPIAGRSFSPYALLEHKGRRSGRAYVTPVGAFPFEDGFVVGLSYGADVDWCRNILASGHAVVKWRGQEFALERPAIIPTSRAVLQAVPSYFRLPARELKEFLWLRRPGPVDEPAPLGSDTARASEANAATSGS